MGGYMNPLTGSGWDQSQSSPLSQTNPINIPGGNYSQGKYGSFGGGAWGNPGNFGQMGETGNLMKNIMLNNVVSGSIKNALAPQWASLMGQYGGDAGKFFENLMNLGSPFYKQHQAEAFNQGVQQNQNAMAQAREQLGAQGYGYGPSGANAAMIGGMAQQGSQNLAEQYLQNLFQNENLQAGGAQGLSSLAQLFNPAQLLGGTSAGVQPPNTSWTQGFNQIMSGLGALGTGVGGAAKGL